VEPAGSTADRDDVRGNQPRPALTATSRCAIFTRPIAVGNRPGRTVSE
jgi:hypothetical protein